MGKTMYELMRQSELMDDDGMDIEEAEDCSVQTDAEKFKSQYKEFTLTSRSVLRKTGNINTNYLLFLCRVLFM